MKTKKDKNLSTEVEEILTMSASKEVIMNDIKMSRVVIKNTYGNIDLLKSFSFDLASRIWKTQKLEKLLQEKTKELTQLGLKKRAVLKKKRQFLRQIGRGVFDTSPLEKDSLLTNETLELEVSKKKKLQTN
ncbi:hypothetical protein COU88_01625 [Candidatus Roizmanbacteria bacterium CG10_big_fil_rev_8_21_14_0_10_39_6]|uniref:Uncharacterized protein n=1 Tax=Candidatus Roizmanbacteria bacterium CG10_big_fil_rev_8_21_14_0_10_39_6 TaxID=1974853 RepID=A0A2M8KT00_9BACT|nr:MAG: hypothetical protein COU88_01625 [Candidatus Roizmanbacteria bacterium CG10_big_fil_rev_8_21_14_0_10_39_6]